MLLKLLPDGFSVILEGVSVSDSLEIRLLNNTLAAFLCNTKIVLNYTDIFMDDSDALFSLSTLFDQVGITKEQKKRIKLVRHSLDKELCKDKEGHKITIRDLYQNQNKDFFYAFECEQDTEIFKGCKYILSFIGDGGKSARLHKCYEIIGMCSGDEKLDKMPVGYPDEASFNKGVYYELKETDILKKFEGRLVIRWEGSAQSWHRWAINNDMPIISISSKIPFPGYELVDLSFEELAGIIDSENSEWFNPLSKACGVYLITTPKGLYVGSAYGRQGLWGRWKEYSKFQNFGVELDDLKNDPSKFSFSILKVLPIRSIDKDVIFWEQHFKKILNTINNGDDKTFWGLNKN